MIKTIEKVFYILYREIRKGNKEYDSACIASLWFSIGVLFFFMAVDTIIRIFFGYCWLLTPVTKWNIILFSVFIILIFFSLFVFSGKFKRIEKKYKDLTKEELRKMTKVAIIYNVLK